MQSLKRTYTGAASPNRGSQANSKLCKLMHQSQSRQEPARAPATHAADSSRHRRAV
jgi:hypothetical protein